MEQCWYDTDRRKPKYLEKTCASATLSTKTSHIDRMGSNPGLLRERMGSNYLSPWYILPRRNLMRIIFKDSVLTAQKTLEAD